MVIAADEPEPTAILFDPAVISSIAKLPTDILSLPVTAPNAIDPEPIDILEIPVVKFDAAAKPTDILSVPDDKSLSTLYSNQKDNVISGEIVLDIKTKNKYLKQISKIIVDESKQLKILEVGADNGSFLKLIKEKNLNSKLYAIEPNNNMHKQLKDITEKNFNNIQEIDNNLKFDLIIAIHVFDHIPNLNQYVQKLKTLLNSNGMIFGVVHNEKSLMAKTLKTRWPAYRLQHPHLFNHDTINLFFNSLNFDKIFIKKTTNFFNLDFLLKHLIMALFKVKIKLPKLFSIGLKLGNFSFLYKKNNH